MITFRPLGKAARRPKRAMACSWLPQTCMTETRRPMSLVSAARAAESALALAGSRNLSWVVPGGGGVMGGIAAR